MKSNPYRLLPAYDVEPVFAAEASVSALEKIRGDFRAIGAFGFDTIMLRHVDPVLRKSVLDVAADEGLDAALVVQELQHYVRTGTGPGGSNDGAKAAREVMDEFVGHVSMAAVVIETGASARATQRGAALCAAIEAGGTSCALIGGVANPPRQSLVRLDTRAAEDDGGTSLLEAWLGAYHRGLIAGRTQGVVFDKHSRAPGDGPALADPGGIARPSVAAAIHEIKERGYLWGPRLMNTKPARLAGHRSTAPEVSVTALSRGARRYVLVFNGSNASYSRGEVVLTARFGSAAVSRAVEVPTSRARPSGRVVEARDGLLVLLVDLRPGDAALFEMF